MYKLYISIKAKKNLNKLEGPQKNALIRLIEKSSNEKWFNSHKKTCKNTDLIILKQNKTAERIGGFIINDSFYIAVVFAKHQVYQNKIRELQQKDFPIENFLSYKKEKRITKKMKKLINENKKLVQKITFLESEIRMLEKSIEDKNKIKELEEVVTFQKRKIIQIQNQNKRLLKDIQKLKYGKKINRQKVS